MADFGSVGRGIIYPKRSREKAKYATPAALGCELMRKRALWNRHRKIGDSPFWNRLDLNGERDPDGLWQIAVRGI